MGEKGKDSVFSTSLAPTSDVRNLNVTKPRKPMNTTLEVDVVKRFTVNFVKYISICQTLVTAAP